MTGLRTGEVAKAAGVNVQTLRYYERRGLLAQPDRTLGGYRLYGEQAVTVLRVIKAAHSQHSAQRDAGCDDLVTYADSRCCPVPFR